MTEQMTDPEELARARRTLASIAAGDSTILTPHAVAVLARRVEQEQAETIGALSEALAFIMLHGDRKDGHDVYCVCPAQTDAANATHSTACAQGQIALRRAGVLK